MSDKFEPNIVGFLCNWCSYAAADLAGSSKLEVPATLTTIRVMCSSRINSVLLLSAYMRGADGVLVAGCHPGDCHYQTGNYYARRRFALLHKILATFNLDPERFRLSWISASEGQRFSQVTREFAEHIRKLGPNPLKSRPFIE
ncbi:methyl-viologen-reducing hydrogenase subunit delta [candidate division TA06 bacterium DG_26]|uniref:Methyl-viologen-reducing hydrogenase subunit delta n=1 Tax=candidate division TA06 bacterium DG_26 TaxID=1703771 RepID=A0A0S7WID0_UNCT6|nr:MAG: methyl-viologen-reducing hydrogenase subunit delta [candidate division TA06 bacterium DG_26]